MGTGSGNTGSGGSGGPDNRDDLTAMIEDDAIDKGVEELVGDFDALTYDAYMRGKDQGTKTAKSDIL